MSEKTQTAFFGRAPVRKTPGFATDFVHRREFYETILSNTPDLVYVFGLDHRFKYANAALLKMWGCKWEDAKGKNCLELGYEPWHAAMHDREIEQVIATRGPIRGEVPFTGTDGRRIYDYIFVPVIGQTGEVEAIAGTTRDITERKRGEEALRESERLQRLLAQVGELSATVPKTSDLIAAISERVAKELCISRCGYARVDLEAGQILVSSDYHGELASVAGAHVIPGQAQYWKEEALAGRAVAFEDMSTDPRTVAFYESSFAPKHIVSQITVPLHREGKWAAIFWASHHEARAWTAAEIDLMRVMADRVWLSVERKRAEEALRDSEEMFRQLAENIPQIAWMAHPDGRIFWYNKRWFDYTGTTDEQMEGCEWEAVLHPAHAERVTEKFRQALARAEGWEDAFPLRGKDGSYRWFLSRAFPIRDAGRKIVRWFGSDTDITELMEAKTALEKAQKQLEEHAADLEERVTQRTAKLTETMGELEAFSYTIAHDMRAPLRAMQNFSAILAVEYSARLDDEGKDLLQRIAVSADRLDQLIRDVLDYSKVVRGDLKLELVDTQALAEEIISSYPDLQPGKADVHFPARLPAVLGNRAALTQVLANLLGNAAKFVAPGVRPRIQIRSEPAAKEFVRFWIEDNGIGIEKKAQKRLFQMFHRANQPGLYEGNGIGLAIVRKAVERMGGRIGVESRLGIGSRFWVELKAD